ncbi:DnaJ domain-containing protein [Bacteriovoracaceae bacterium]|nr:DnaJ domain-containing protein [Bacteriovoracaceae bacterium]
MGIFQRLKDIVQSEIGDKLTSNEVPPIYKQSQQQDEPQPSTQNRLEASYYANLELPYGANYVDIKKAYKRLMKKYHPDRFHHDEDLGETANEITKKLNEAYNYFTKKFD